MSEDKHLKQIADCLQQKPLEFAYGWQCGVSWERMRNAKFLMMASIYEDDSIFIGVFRKECPDFVAGFECGSLYVSMGIMKKLSITTFGGRYPKDTLALLRDMAHCYGYTLEMKKMQGDDECYANYVEVTFSNDSDWIAQRPEQDRDL